MRHFGTSECIECVFRDSTIAYLQRVAHWHHHSNRRALETSKVFVQTQDMLGSRRHFAGAEPTSGLSGRAFAMAESTGCPLFGDEFDPCGIVGAF